MTVLSSICNRIYATGDGVAKNRVEAATWLGKAAEQGYPQAKEMLTNVSAGRDPLANRGCLLMLLLPFAVVLGWLGYHLILSS